MGEYPAGTLLVTWADEVRHRAVPWSHFQHPSGRHFPAFDANGNPVYPLTDITEEQLRAALVVKEPEADPVHVVE